MVKAKILFVLDVPGWAYDLRGNNWINFLSRDYKIDKLYLSNYKTIKDDNNDVRVIVQRTGQRVRNNIFNCKKYDGILFFFSKAPYDKRLMYTDLDFNKIGVSVNNEKWTNVGPLQFYNEYLIEPKIVTASNDFIIDSFKPYRPDILKLSQVVNPRDFHSNRRHNTSNRIGASVIVGWSGNPNNELKNLNNIKTACMKSQVKLRIAHKLNTRKLNSWYNDIDIYVNASFSEGGPNSILEAGICKIPYITTNVGLCREIIKDEKNGIIINDDVKSITLAIKKLSENIDLRKKLSNQLYKEVNRNWTYRKKLNEIKTVLRKLVSKG